MSETFILHKHESPLNDKAINTVVKTIFKHIEYNAPYELSIVFTDDAEVQNLNKQYRHKDKPTNVLSFPAQDEFSPQTLGDVVISIPTVEKEAIEQNKSTENHLTHLIVHGVLHLLGYDHEEDTQATEMESLEIEILKLLDIKDPYK